MAVKKVESKEMNRFVGLTRKVALAYVGAFGVVADELGKLFETFVTRGERMQKDARKLVKESSKEVRQLAHDAQKEQKAAVAHASKNVKKAVKRVEHAIA